jgi:AcrR family transcriptional regulator
MLAEPQAVAVPSLRSIASACNVAPSAVYWHFPSESELRQAVLDFEYADLINTVDGAIADLPQGKEALIAAGEAYVTWGLEHPGAYQLLFESSDALPPTRADRGPRIQSRIVEMAAAIDPSIAFASALLLWSAQHGLVSLRLHKTDWDWQLSPGEAVARMVNGLVLQPDPRSS